MTHTHLLGLLGQPALITATAYTAAKELILARIAGQPQAVREGSGPCGEEVEMPQMVIADGIAVIPVAGILGWKLSSMEKGSGCTDYRDIIEDIEVASTDPTVTTIVFDIDSPGGMVSGVSECADAIAMSGKRTIAYGSGLVCSAAYWLACGCDEIWATPSATIGSIGVYVPHHDVTEMLAKEGIKVRLFASGTLKGAGYPGVPLTEAQAIDIQASVDAINVDFQAFVTSARGAIDGGDMQGQTFRAVEAQNRGLIDVITADWHDTLGEPEAD
jgi:signal peptide peptidase SppA